MADGRMLKRAISTSKKLAMLGSDSARLLYTWQIPFLDIEGRMHAYPSIVRGMVVPLLKTFTDENIKKYLKELADIGLINLYEVDGEMYQKYEVYDKHQNLRHDREKKSLIPPPPGGLREDSGRTPGNCRGKLRYIKLNKDKLNQGNPEFSNLPNIGRKLQQGGGS